MRHGPALPARAGAETTENLVRSATLAAPCKPALEHHKAPVRARCVAANDVAVPSNRIRVGNEDPAGSGARAKHRLSFARLIGQRDGETLLNQKIGDSLLDVRRARRALIWTYNQF